MVCIQCISEYDKERFRSPEAKRKNIEGVKKYKKKMREWYNGLKTEPCTDCGGIFHHAAMHWDHLPGVEKVGNLSRLVNLGSKKKILAELEKCELVCANCHAVRTYERGQDQCALDSKRVV